jgi:8-oxo-dGTP pyrophosphatase MutT (NUDIX family)
MLISVPDYLAVLAVRPVWKDERTQVEALLMEGPNGYLKIPGGKREGGEEPEAGALRECLEELEVIPKDLRFLHAFGEDRRFKRLLYVFTRWEGEVRKKVTLEKSGKVLHIPTWNLLSSPFINRAVTASHRRMVRSVTFFHPSFFFPDPRVREADTPSAQPAC